MGYGLVCGHSAADAIHGFVALVVYEQDGQLLTSDGGPLRLIVPGDERGRPHWRGLAQITVLSQPAERD